MDNPITKNYINYLNNWKNIIFRVDIHLIWGCNFKCIMCDNWKKKIELNFNFEDLQKYIIILKKKYNCNYIRFHWQEPSLYNKLEDLVLFTKKLWIKVAIKTNGRFINNNRFAKLLAFWLDELCLSIDWPNAEIHDKIRWIKWSFDKNVDLIKKWKKINPKLRIYINSVVMKSNFENLDQMLDFWKKYSLDRVSFVFLNDKNRKNINEINLDKEIFYSFFKNQVLNIYKKSKIFNILVDFSPFLSDLVFKDNDYIINELENNFSKYIYEIGSFYNWDYGKYFYDKYGCFWPIDHASINYNWDMYGCCVVERDSSNSIWNILKDNLEELWNSEKYKKYRSNSNEKCDYAEKCASNFYTRKSLFKDIYLDNNLYQKNNPINYYRYLKEFQYENEEIKNKIKINKFKNILLNFYDKLDFYRNLLEKNNINMEDIESIDSLNFIKNLPILDKKILKENFPEIKEFSIWKTVLNWKTSWDSWEKFEFFYPLNFQRYIKQIAIFSEEFDFTYNDSYFSLTPINCNQTIINNLEEPEYVKKIYITIWKIEYEEKLFKNIEKIFNDNKNINFLHWDSKYLLFLILWFKKFNLKLPKLKGISLTYTYTNKSLKKFIEKKFDCKVYDNYWCSEIWPITIEKNWKKEIFGDNIIIEEINWKIIVSDLDNDIFPFIRYKNGDYGKFDWDFLDIYWKESQILNWKNLKEIDDFFYKNYSEIITYQFDLENMYYISLERIDEEKLKKDIKKYFWEYFNIINLKNDKFFKLGECSKFKIVN